MIKEKIQSRVNNLLEVSGIMKLDGEHPVRQALHHLYTAVAMYEQMSDVDRAFADKTKSKLSKLITPRLTLKMRDEKRKKNKEKFSPTPPIKGKIKKEKTEKENIYIAERNLSSVPSLTFEERKENFRQECLKFVGKFDTNRLKDFYLYYTEVNQETGKMKFEEETYWSTEGRIERWMNTNYSIVNTTAAINQQRTKKRQTQEMKQTQQLQAAALARQQEEERQAQKDAESRQNRQSSTDYVNQNPNGFLARMYRESEREKAAKVAKGPKGTP